MTDLEIQQRLMRPFVKRAMATADGAANGTTIVAPQVPALGEFGLGEANDFWRDAEVLLLTGEMKDQLRRVTGWVQATGTLTVDHRFNNPNVSLLTGNVLADAVIIPVVDASVFSAGEAYIWDLANAETVTITLVDTVLNQLTIAAPGLVNGYTVAAGAAISMSPRILGPVVGPPAVPGTMFLIMTPMKTQDTGEHTNPRRYEKDNGFVSAPIAVVGPATLLWAPGTPCVRNPSGVPANGRTAGGITTVYTMELRNPNVAAQTAWLETTGAVVVSVVYEIAANDTTIVDFVAGKTFGDMDLYVNGSVAAIECQLEGTEV